MSKPKRALNRKTQDDLRQRIQADHLIASMQKHALSDIESMSDGEARAMNSRLDAAKFLLTRAISPPVPKDDDGKTPSGPVIITWGS